MPAAEELPGVSEGDMSIEDSQRKHGTTRGSPRRWRFRPRTARASRINRRAVKSRCARKWGAWGRLSVDGPRHYNLDRSEGPWGKAVQTARTVVHQRTASPDSERGYDATRQLGARRTEANRATRRFLRSRRVSAPSDRFRPCSRSWRKSAVRNVRGERWRRRHHAKPGAAPRPYPAGWKPAYGSDIEALSTETERLG